MSMVELAMIVCLGLVIVIALLLYGVVRLVVGRCVPEDLPLVLRELKPLLRTITGPLTRAQRTVSLSGRTNAPHGDAAVSPGGGNDVDDEMEDR